MSPSTAFAADDLSRLDELVSGARESGAEGLNVSTSGNISVRLTDGGRIVISAARTRLARLRLHEVVAVDISTGEHLVGLAGESEGQRPSRETPMHCACYGHARVGAVLHFQSLAATQLACSAGELPDLNFIPEFPVYIRRVASVPYLPPGSQELADAVSQALSDDDVRVVQLGNHGQLAVGEDVAQAVERATFFELACRLALDAQRNGLSLRTYSDTELETLRSYG